MCACVEAVSVRCKSLTGLRIGSPQQLDLVSAVIQANPNLTSLSVLELLPSLDASQLLRVFVPNELEGGMGTLSVGASFAEVYRPFRVVLCSP